MYGSEDEVAGSGPGPEVIILPSPSPKVHEKETNPNSRGVPPNRGESSAVGVARAAAATQPTVFETLAAPVKPGSPMHLDRVMSAEQYFGEAWMEYYKLKKILKDMLEEFKCKELSQVKKVVDARPSQEQVRGLEQRITELAFDNNRLREQVRIKDGALAAHQ